MRSEDYATTQRRLAMADVLAELPEEVITARPDPSAGRVRLTPPICTMGEDTHFTQFDVLATLGNGRHLMMGDDPRLPKMPAQPRLADFFRHRFVPLVANHLLQSARLAEKAGLDERIVMACLLHDIALAGLITSDHGYWGAQLIEPYGNDLVRFADTIAIARRTRHIPRRNIRGRADVRQAPERRAVGCKSIRGLTPVGILVRTPATPI
jgi:hypothetical protein